MVDGHVEATELVPATELAKPGIEIQQDAFQANRCPNFFVDSRNTDTNDSGQSVGGQILHDGLDRPLREVELSLELGLDPSGENARRALKVGPRQFFGCRVTGVVRPKFSGRREFGAGVTEVERVVDFVVSGDVVKRRQRRDVFLGALSPLLLLGLGHVGVLPQEEGTTLESRNDKFEPRAIDRIQD